MRKGTRSCTECRRRKLRCVWASDSAKCNRCQESGRMCVPQTASSPSQTQSNQTSKQRIAALERKVEQLTGSVRTLQSANGHQPSHLVSPIQFEEHESGDHNARTGSADEDDSSEDDAIMLDSTNPRMESLFHNEWLSANTPDQVLAPEDKQERCRTQLLAQSRKALQNLIPSKDDLVSLSACVSKWSSIVGEMFPKSEDPLTQEELLNSFEHMKTDNVDVWALARWLLSLAITAQQIRHDDDVTTEDSLQNVRHRYAFAQTVEETLEQSLFSHDSLLGTVEGLGASLQYIRLTLTRGTVQRTWLYVRRIVAVAELLGLHRSAKRIRSLRQGDQNVNMEVIRTRVWASICAVDRLCGILNNLPIATRSHSLAFMSEGQIVPKPLNFLLRLSNAAIEIQDLDDIRGSHASTAELYAAVLKIDSSLKSLNPAMFGLQPTQPGSPITATDQLIFLYHCMEMQCLLPFVLRRDLDGKYLYGRMAGVEACRNVSYHWQRLRSTLPSGFFLAQIMDLQAFTAAVVLLLICYNSRTSVGMMFHASSAEVEASVDQTVQILERQSKKPFSSRFTRQTVTTLKALTELLLGRTNSGSKKSELVVNVPLLGKLHIRRCGPDQEPAENNSDWTSNMAFPESMENNTLGLEQSNEANNFMAQQLDPYDPVFWTIEDDNNYLPDFMGTQLY